MEPSSPTRSDSPPATESAFAKRMALAYTDDYLRIMGIEHYRLGYFDPDIAPDDLPTALERYAEVLVGPLNLGPSSVVLELGCAAGATTAWLVRRYGCTVYAVDIVDDMIKAAKARFELEQITDRAFAMRMDVQNLEFKEAMFDAVIGIEVVNHFPDKLAFFKKLAAVLKPGGQIALSEYMLEPGGPKIGEHLVRMIVESERLEGEAAYRSYLAAAGLSSTSITDHYRETILGTNRAFLSDRYQARIKAYAYVYFGVVIAVAYKYVLRLWAYMFEKGHARHVFLHSRKPPT